MVFVVGKTLIDLGPCELRETFRRQSIDGFASLEEADDIVDTNSSALYGGVTAPDARCAHDVAVAFRNHAMMLRFFPASCQTLVTRNTPPAFAEVCVKMGFKMVI